MGYWFHVRMFSHIIFIQLTIPGLGIIEKKKKERKKKKTERRAKHKFEK